MLNIFSFVPIKYMPIISAVGLFCIDKLEDNQTRKCSTFFQMLKLTKPYFKKYLFVIHVDFFKVLKNHFLNNISFGSLKILNEKYNMSHILEN